MCIRDSLGDVPVEFGDLLGTATGAEEAPVVKLLQTVFEEAMRSRASDIHIEPQDRSLRVRFRIDGVLHVQTEADAKIASALALRLKLISGLDISEKRLPQDGRFAITVRNNPVDVRISTMPTQYGESVVMRLLNQNTGLLGLERLNMPPHTLARLRHAVRRPSGMVLVTGPTGSGKTTTLYATLSELNTTEKKIITVEDPVEYRLPGINPVSYTHLDVYKRQTQASFGFWNGHQNAPAFQITHQFDVVPGFRLLDLCLDLERVADGQLDLVKRHNALAGRFRNAQLAGITFTSLRMMRRLLHLCTCLLYTSRCV